MMNHFGTSIVKSVVRIIGCTVVIVRPEAIVAAAACFLVAEVLGILEEFADKRKEK